MAAQNIFAQFAQPVRSVAEHMADYDAQDMRRMQIEGGRRQNELAAITGRQQMEASQQNALERAARLRAAQDAGGDEATYAKALRLTGFPGNLDAADKVDKAIGERRKTESDIKGKTSENAKRDTETENAVVMMWRDMIGNATNPQQAAQMVQAMHTDPRIANTPMARVPLNQAMQMLQQTPFDQWKQQFALGAAKFVEMNKPQYVTQNLGGTSRIAALPGLGAGPAVTATEAPITQSADNAATQATARANQARMSADAAAGRAVTVRGQNLVDARARDNGASNAGGVEDPTQAALNKKFGKPEAGRRWKPDGSLEPIPGGSADRKTNEQLSGKETVDSVVASLRQSYDSLNTGGGITSTEKGPAGNLSAALSRSSVGQTVGGAFGTRNQKERDAVAQARPLLLQAIMKATGMSAKQMDSNAELKLYLATATDPTLTLEANREALDRIEKLYGSGGTGAAPAKPGKMVKRTGTSNGRKVVEYTDGSIEYAD